MPPSTNPDAIHVGRGDLYVGVAIPVTPPVVLVSGVPGTGRYVGSTMAESIWASKPKEYRIRTQQSTGVVGYVVIEEDLEVEFTFGELVYENLRDFFAAPLDQTTYISVGGLIFPTTKSLLVVAPRRQGGFIQAMMYDGYFGGDRQFTASREKDSPFKVMAMAKAVTSRQFGDQLGFIHPGP